MGWFHLLLIAALFGLAGALAFRLGEWLCERGEIGGRRDA